MHRYFWDVDPRLLDITQHEHSIIERLLERGDLESIRWLLKTYDRSRIANVVRVSRSLSRKSRNFWELYLDAPTSKTHV